MTEDEPKPTPAKRDAPIIERIVLTPRRDSTILLEMTLIMSLSEEDRKNPTVHRGLMLPLHARKLAVDLDATADRATEMFRQAAEYVTGVTFPDVPPSPPATSRRQRSKPRKRP